MFLPPMIFITHGFFFIADYWFISNFIEKLEMMTPNFRRTKLTISNHFVETNKSP